MSQPEPRGLGTPGNPDSETSAGGPTLKAFLVGAAIVIAITVLWPAFSSSRNANRRALCKDRLRQIGMALRNYHDEYACYPPAYVADEEGRPMHSWRVLLLPYLSQASLYEEYRFDEPWNGPNNSRLANRAVDVYRCPSEEAEKGSPESYFTSFVAVVGPQTAWPGSTSTRISDVKDDPAGTLHLVEIAGSGIHWMEPRDLNIDHMAMALNDGDGEGISSRHPGGAHVLLSDGSVRFFQDDQATPELIRHLLAIDDEVPVRDEF